MALRPTLTGGLPLVTFGPAAEVSAATPGVLTPLDYYARPVLARRLLFLAAVLLAVTVLAAALAPPPAEPPSGNASPAPARKGSSSVSTRTIDASGPEQEIGVDVGDTVRLTIESRMADSVEVVGLDRLVTVTPESPVELEILADQPGTFPLVLVEADREIARLVVSR